MACMFTNRFRLFQIFINGVKVYFVTDIEKPNKVLMYKIKKKVFKLTVRFHYSSSKCEFNFIHSFISMQP